LEINIVEDEVHSNLVCRQCFKMVNEFADLESRAGEIRNNMLSNYNSTLRAFDQEEEEEVITEEVENTEEDDGPLLLDANKLNEIVQQSGNRNLKNFMVQNQDGTIERVNKTFKNRL